MPLSMGSLAKALRLDKDDKRRTKVQFCQGYGDTHTKLELDQERKKFNRKVKDVMARSKDDEIIRIRCDERKRHQNLEKELKKTEKSIENVVRLQKNREWRKKREEAKLSSMSGSLLSVDKANKHYDTRSLDEVTIDRNKIEKLNTLKSEIETRRQNSNKT